MRLSTLSVFAFTLTLSSHLSGVLGAPVPFNTAAGLSPLKDKSSLQPIVLASVSTFEGEAVPDQYIVTLGKSVDKAAFVENLRSGVLAEDPEDDSELIYSKWNSSTVNAFSGKFTPVVLEKIRAMKGVEYIEEEGIMGASVETEQGNATWGISRLSRADKLENQNVRSLNFSYSFDSQAGEGVDVYVVDTGINVDHVEFQGRASLGAVFGSQENRDGNGHGTHVAGTVGGANFGVAKKANLIAVKVLRDDGSGSVADIISGLNFVRNNVAKTGKPSVINMSLGGGRANALDAAVRGLLEAGVHVVLAAGNDNQDANGSSPARVKEAITVAASTIADSKASFSNFGDAVDIWAPGQQIISASIASNTAVRSLSGTSMACPHVAGLVAYLVSREGNKPPAEVAARLVELGVKDKITGVPEGTVNLLARNDI